MLAARPSCSCSLRPARGWHGAAPARWSGRSRPAPRSRPQLRAAPEQDAPPAAAEPVRFDKILLAVLDPNPYLSDGSRQAIATAADLAKVHKGKVTVLVLDHPDQAGDPGVKLQVIRKSLQEAGCEGADILEKALESGSVPAVIGDVADDIAADLAIVHSDAIHAKQVDANLLAELCPCPQLLLP